MGADGGCHLGSYLAQGLFIAWESGLAAAPSRAIKVNGPAVPKPLPVARRPRAAIALVATAGRQVMK